ncbi:MAG: oxygen-independent coproporphyrinogen III oxidase [Nitrospirae bacterium]|nr:oxygen-independent coproporphyrinogen III oxidase [Nitrospirota bacterium]
MPHDPHSRFRAPVVVDRRLIAKYDKAGPRYTSYPTAPHFSERFDAAAYRAEIARSNREESGRPLSLYFHLPFCDTLCYYCGCNVVVTQKREKVIPYLAQIKHEIAAVAAMIAPGRKVTQLHWGGGTPTYLAPDQIRDLMAFVHAHFDFADDVEAGVELDPRECDRERLVALRESGFNRASMGIQDFDSEIQVLVNRVQPVDMTRRVFDTCRELGFHSVNVDLIYGLPLQTVARFTPTVDEVIDMAPDRIATFNYAHVPWLKKHQVLIPEDLLPTPAQKLDIFEMVSNRFADAGYVFIGMDHFAKPDDEIARAQREGTLYRNFQGYTTHAGCDLYAFGITAIGQLRRSYTQNVKKLSDYYAALDNGELPVERGILLTDEDLLRREVITRLMCDFALDPAMFETRYGIDFDTHFAHALAEFDGFAADGLVTKDGRKFTVTPAGRLLIRNMAMPFDAYLGTKPNQRFSRTV